jgi:hypothetical protein
MVVTFISDEAAVGRTLAGSYEANADGTLTFVIPNFVRPQAPLTRDAANEFRFQGVMANGGQLCRVFLAGVSVGGKEQPSSDSVVYGEFIKR